MVTVHVRRFATPWAGDCVGADGEPQAMTAERDELGVGEPERFTIEYFWQQPQRGIFFVENVLIQTEGPIQYCGDELTAPLADLGSTH
jgi:hypothetical protein